MILHILLNLLPCSGFMKKSASMFVQGRRPLWLHLFLFYPLWRNIVGWWFGFSLNLRIFHSLLLSSHKIVPMGA